MFWDTSIEQDRDGYWVMAYVGNPYDYQRFGPYASQDEADAAQLQARIELHRRHGSPTTI